MANDSSPAAPDYIKLSLLVKMRLLFSDELKIAAHAKATVFPESFVRDALDQKLAHVAEQRSIIKGLFFLIFASYLVLNGSNISIPGIGISLKDVPGVLPLLVVAGSFSVTMLIINFINLQSYDALIDQFVLKMSGDGLIDPDIVRSSLEPFHFIHKLFRKQFNVYDKNTFEIEKYGRIFNSVVLFFVGLFLFVPLIFFLFYFMTISIVYLGADYLGIFVRFVSITSFCLSILLILSIVINFRHTITPK